MGCSTSREASSSSAQQSISQQPLDSGEDHPAISDTLALGAGCYWGTEKFIVKNFQKKFPNSIADAKVGFMSENPHNPIKNPTYKQVCAGNTGYVEVLNIKLKNPTPQLFEELIRFFFTFHDPTTMNRQGNDWGSQYASVIFCTDDLQVEIAQKIRNELQQLLTNNNLKVFAQKEVSTGIVEYSKFVKAHEAHQRYLSKHPLGYCNHRIRFKNWPKALS